MWLLSWTQQRVSVCCPGARISLGDTGGQITFEDLGELAYGRRGRAAVQACVLFLQLGICSVFISLTGENLTTFLDEHSLSLARWQVRRCSCAPSTSPPAVHPSSCLQRSLPLLCSRLLCSRLLCSRLVSSALVSSPLVSSRLVSSRLVSSRLLSSPLLSSRLVSSPLVSPRLVSSHRTPSPRTSQEKALLALEQLLAANLVPTTTPGSTGSSSSAVCSVEAMRAALAAYMQSCASALAKAAEHAAASGSGSDDDDEGAAVGVGACEELMPTAALMDEKLRGWA
jgi:hypothetical protein